jgi:hypothetical protein
MAKLKITHTSGGQIHDRYTGPHYINGAYVGGTGGLTSQTGSQIQGQSFITGASSQACSILAQKGAHKFRVQDALGNKGICTLMNSPNVTAGKMNILITLNGGAANIAAANVAGGATSTTVTFDTRTTVTGPVRFPRVGDYVIWTSPSANIGSVVQVTAVNGTTNFTIGTTGNVAASTGTVVTTNTYASKINNRYVWDWASDGQMDSTSGTTTFMTSGFNPNRYRYHLATQDATFVKVQNA